MSWRLIQEPEQRKLKPSEVSKFQHVIDSDSEDSSDEKLWKKSVSSSGYQRVVNNVYYELSQSDWSRDIDEICKKYLENDTEMKIKTPEDLANLVTAEARKLIPDSVKQSLFLDIQELLFKNST